MKKINISIVVILAYLMFSCDENKFFELDQPPQSPWQNVDEFEFAVAGVYKYSFSSDGNWSSPYALDRYLYFGISEAARRIEEYTSSFPTAEVYSRDFSGFNAKADASWRANFVGILNANAALDFASEDSPFPNMSDADIANLDRAKGELLALRAYNYFSLVRRHAPAYNPTGANDKEVLPLKTTVGTSLESNNAPEIGTVEEIYNQITSDLTQAKGLLPTDFSGFHPSYDETRITKFTAAGLLARVYFQMSQYEKALDELDFVIDQNGGLYDLTEDPFEAFSHGAASSRGSEVIWYMPGYSGAVTLTAPRDFSLINKPHYRAKNGGRGDDWSRIGWHEFALSHDAMIQVGWMDANLDITAEALLDKRYDQLYYRFEPFNQVEFDAAAGDDALTLAYNQTYEVKVGVDEPNIWIDKYYRGTTGSVDGQFSNIPMMRLAEMYLIRAAIKVKLGQDALSDINAVRSRAGLVDLTSVAIDDVYAEWIKELSGEESSVRFLQSLQLPIPSGDRDGSSIAAPYAGFFWSPPQSELDLNQNLGG